MSKGNIVLTSALLASVVLAASMTMQWLVYHDWLHRTGPLRIVGTSIAVLLTFFFALRWQLAVRAKALEMIRRLDLIARLKDRVRNSLQAIECTTYLGQPEITASVKREVEAIDVVLREVLADVALKEST